MERKTAIQLVEMLGEKALAENSSVDDALQDVHVWIFIPEGGNESDDYNVGFHLIHKIWVDGDMVQVGFMRGSAPCNPEPMPYHTPVFFL